MNNNRKSGVILYPIFLFKMEKTSNEMGVVDLVLTCVLFLSYL